eukprot:SAG22_NODE_517_length_9528_cov_3.821508_2_plen_309_part_00
MGTYSAAAFVANALEHAARQATKGSGRPRGRGGTASVAAQLEAVAGRLSVGLLGLQRAAAAATTAVAAAKGQQVSSRGQPPVEVLVGRAVAAWLRLELQVQAKRFAAVPAATAAEARSAGAGGGGRRRPRELRRLAAGLAAVEAAEAARRWIMGSSSDEDDPDPGQRLVFLPLRLVTGRQAAVGRAVRWVAALLGRTFAAEAAARLQAEEAAEEVLAVSPPQPVRCPGLHSWTPAAAPVSCLLTGVPGWRPGERRVGMTRPSAAAAASRRRHGPAGRRVRPARTRATDSARPATTLPPSPATRLASAS